MLVSGLPLLRWRRLAGDRYDAGERVAATRWRWLAGDRCDVSDRAIALDPFVPRRFVRPANVGAPKRKTEGSSSAEAFLKHTLPHVCDMHML